MDKKSLSERDICTKYITPSIEKAGWDSSHYPEFCLLFCKPISGLDKLKNK